MEIKIPETYLYDKFPEILNLCIRFDATTLAFALLQIFMFIILTNLVF